MIALPSMTVVAYPWDRSNVLRSGATGLGVTDDTDALQSALTLSCALTGGVAMMYLPRGKYRITRSLKLPSACKKLVVFGDPDGGMQPDYLDVAPTGSVVNCREVCGPVFEIWDAIETGQTTMSLRTIGIEAVTFDGANGESRLESSTTCTGLFSVRPGISYPPETMPTMSIRLAGVCMMNLATVGAKAIDLSRAFWILVENCAALYIVNGYGLHISSANFATTTVTIRKTYLHGCLECATFGANVLSCELDAVVFESSLIAMSSFLNPIKLKDCWFEAIGSRRSTAPQARRCLLPFTNEEGHLFSTAAPSLPQSGTLIRGCAETAPITTDTGGAARLSSVNARVDRMACNSWPAKLQRTDSLPPCKMDGLTARMVSHLASYLSTPTLAEFPTVRSMSCLETMTLAG
jgi:hypothetical protein